MHSLADIGLNWLLQEEDCENDDRRFYCSYLIGHISLIADEFSDNERFVQQINDCLSETLPTDNLTENDQLGIKSLWQEVCQLNTN